MEPKKVLVFPAGTEIAFEILNALKFSKFVELYGVNSVPSHGEFVFKNYIETDLPYITDPGFIDRFNSIIDQYGIEYVYPAHDDALYYLTRDEAKIHAGIVTSPFQTVDVCRSKNKTYDFFKGETFIPENYPDPHRIRDFPVFAKPSVGQGSVGARKINNKSELDNLMQEGKEYAICEYLPGEEYTVDCFTDRKGKLRSCHLRRRERIRTGIAVRSRLIPTDEAVLKIAEKINSSLVFQGAWFFQLKKNTRNDYRLMEISPRIPGTMGTSRNLGINYPMLTLFSLWDYDVDIIDNGIEIVLDRAFISRYKTSARYARVYMDFDDTLYLGDKVNIQMVAFLYQCFNKGIPVTLLTKHEKDIHESLAKYCISESLFDRIIHIGQGEDKSRYITDRDAILVDDSFAERKRVKDQTGIPVYDLDMIESLLDWRM